MMNNIQCPVCGYYCLGKGGHGCIDKPTLCGYERVELDLSGLAHEIWAASQLLPEEGIEDGVDRIIAILKREGGR